MRIIALDLGTTTLGIAMTDKTNTIASPYKTLKFNHEDYESVLEPLKEIIETNNITKVLLGLPKNMDNTEGFAAQRSINFKNMLDNYLNIDTILIDERLTTVMAHKILSEQDIASKKRKQVIDSMSAVLILETYLGRMNNNEE